MTFPLGLLADRLDLTRLLTVAALVRAVGFACFALVDGFVGFIVVALLLGAVERAMPPLVQILVVDHVPTDQRVTALAHVRVLRNSGLALGALLATVPLSLFSLGPRVLRPSFQLKAVPLHEGLFLLPGRSFGQPQLVKLSEVLVQRGRVHDEDACGDLRPERVQRPVRHENELPGGDAVGCAVYVDAQSTLEDVEALDAPRVPVRCRPRGSRSHLPVQQREPVAGSGTSDEDRRHVGPQAENLGFGSLCQLSSPLTRNDRMQKRPLGRSGPEGELRQRVAQTSTTLLPRSTR